MLDATTTRWALRLLGIVYPGYLTYKTLEHDRKRGENQRGWCIYWAVASAWLGCVAPVLDLVFDGRVALYGESKLAFTVYLWHPRFQGAVYVYDRFLAPFLAKHERAVDDVLANVFERVGSVFGAASDAAWKYGRRAARDALAKATEAQMRQQVGGAASGRADRIDRTRGAGVTATRGM